MDERVMQFRVGVMVLATFLITAILVVIFFNPHNIGYSTYTVHIHFPTANVTKDTPVRKSGVLIGRVASVELQDERGVLVTAKIDGDRKLFLTDIPRVNTTLMGDTVIDFMPSPEPLGMERSGPPTPIKPGGTTHEGSTAENPLVMMSQMQSSVSTVITSVRRTSDEMGRLATRFNSVLDDKHGGLSKMIDNADATMTAIRTAMGSFNDVVTDPVTRRDLKDAIQQMPILLHEARDTLGKLNGGFELVTTNLQNFEKFTKPLGDQAPEMIKHVDSVVQDMDMLVNQMRQFAQSLNTSQGTVGQLVNNPELYNNLNSAVRQINELTKELRPIIYDARVFTDKIARHPETLGVRGAIERNSGIK